MFKPLYDNANITICGAYCALMEFKRACKLPFTTIEMLLELLQLLCSPGNCLPQSVYKFFEQFSSPHQKHKFCADCNKVFTEEQSQCDNQSCHPTEPNTLITFNPNNALRRVLKSEFV